MILGRAVNPLTLEKGMISPDRPRKTGSCSSIALVVSREVLSYESFFITQKSPETGKTQPSELLSPNESVRVPG